MILTILTLCQKITFAQFHLLSNNRKKNNEQELKSFRPLWTVDQSAVMTDWQHFILFRGIFFPILTNCSLCWLQGLLVNVIAEDSCSALALTKSIQSIMHSASGPRPARWKAQRYVWLIFNSLSPRGRCDWWIWDLIIVKKTDVYRWLNGKQSVL